MIKNKFVKYVTRDYSLRDRSLMMDAFMKKGSIKEIYYTKSIEHRHDGVVDVYILPKDVESNNKRLRKAIRKDKKFISKNLAKGLRISTQLLNVCYIPHKKITHKEAIGLLLDVKKVWQEFSSFLEFTHRIGNLGVELNDGQLKELGEFHDKRKNIFLKFFSYLDKICISATVGSDIEIRDFRFLTFTEIIAYFNGKISAKTVNDFQKRRAREYVYESSLAGEKVVDIGTKAYFRKVDKKYIANDDEKKELKGIAITKGKIQGETVCVSQANYRKKHMAGKIIVTTMTTPSMNASLKSAAGIITEEGGLLSHASIISREFNIITLTQVKNATKVLKDGDLVEVDADRGVVKILKRKK